MNSLKSTKEHYQLAVELVVSQAQKDPNIIAAILYGSLSHDQVWEKSDLDLWLITVDNPKNTNFYSLVSNDIFMHVDLIPRGQFKRSLESGLVNSWSEMVFVRSTLLFSKDQTIQTWYQNHHRFQVGERDRKFALLQILERALPKLETAKKEFFIKQDMVYAFISILDLIDLLAGFEVIWNGEVPGREKIQPALEYNSTFFNFVYHKFINQPKTADRLEQVLNAIDQYLFDHRSICQPIFDYLHSQSGPRSITEIDSHLKLSSRQPSHFNVYNWLACQGILQKSSLPTSLTHNNLVKLDETAYSYDPDSTSIPEFVTQSQINSSIEQFIEQAQLDSNVVAGLLFGDPAQNQNHLWSTSHLHITLIIQEKVKSQSRYILQQNGIDLCVDMVPRNTIRRRLSQARVGDEYYNWFVDSRILFTKDLTIPQWYTDIQRYNTKSDQIEVDKIAPVSSRDGRIQLMNLGCMLSATLAKAEKWFYVKNDLNYSFVYILKAVEDLARVEIFRNHQIPGKKPLHQAVELNPDFFQLWGADLIERKKDKLTVQQALTSLTEYMSTGTEEMFKLVLDYLKAENRICTATDLYHNFADESIGSVVLGCEWMVRQGWLERMGVPLQLTPNSSSTVEEIAYLYDFLEEDLF